MFAPFIGTVAASVGMFAAFTEAFAAIAGTFAAFVGTKASNSAVFFPLIPQYLLSTGY